MPYLLLTLSKENFVENLLHSERLFKCPGEFSLWPNSKQNGLKIDFLTIFSDQRAPKIDCFSNISMSTFAIFSHFYKTRSVFCDRLNLKFV